MLATSNKLPEVPRTSKLAEVVSTVSLKVPSSGGKKKKNCVVIVERKGKEVNWTTRHPTSLSSPFALVWNRTHACRRGKTNCSQYAPLVRPGAQQKGIDRTPPAPDAPSAPSE